LMEDPNSRRAVASMFDPSEDYWYDKQSIDHKRPKDVPCNDWLHFYIRDDKLNLHIAQRSCDLWWGFSGINAFEFSVLHEAMACWLNVKVGEITWFITSLHLYDQHWKRAGDMMREFYSGRHIYAKGYKSILIDTNYEAFHQNLDDLFKLEEMYWMNATLGSNTIIIDPFLRGCANMLQLYAYIKTKDIPKREVIEAIIVKLPQDSDFRMAAVDYMRRNKVIAGDDADNFYKHCIAIKSQ
jgi:thymidylate synthase